MKTLITIVLIISVTVISWSSCAKNTQISTNNLYEQSSLSAKPMVSKPFLTNHTINESFVFIPNNVLNNHNFLFEITMIFNDKLQQLIAFFSRVSSETKDVIVTNQNTKKIVHNSKSCNEST